MSGIRGSVAAFVVALAIAPPAAWGAAPGDSVPFSIPDSELGDTYTVWIDGQQVAAGADETDELGVSGSFTMPDLGSKPHTATLTIGLVRVADGTSASYQSSVEYTPTASPPNPQPSPSPAPGPSQPPSSSPPPASSPATPQQPAPDSGVEWLSGVGVDGGSAVGDIAKDTISVLGGAIGKAVKPRSRRRAVRRGHHKAHKRKHRKRKVNVIKPTPDPPTVQGRHVDAPRDTRRDLSGDDFAGFGYTVAWRLLAGVALAGLLLPLLIGAGSRSRRRQLKREEAAIEAELQQLVNELTGRQAAAIEYALRE